ncbi:MAG: hypothetical protein U0Y10_24000 [Spirosomataceae bacterium]
MKKRLFHIVMAACFGWQCSSQTDTVQQQALGKWTLQVPDSVRVGQAFVLKLKGTSPVDEPIYLLRHGTWGTSVLTIATEQSLSLTDTLAGWVSVQVVTQAQVLAQAHYRVAAAEVSAPLDAYLGSKSVIANAQDWAMLTAIPTDTFGNLVSDGTPLRIDLIRPNGQSQSATYPTRFGLAYHRITAQSKAGKTLAYVYAQNTRSREKELLEVADYPVDFQIFTENNTPYADARQTFRIRTEPLRDRYGNLIPDGTLVTFRCQDARPSQRFMSAYTLGGMASISLQNPATAGSMTIEAMVAGGGSSQPLTLNFLPRP